MMRWLSSSESWSPKLKKSCSLFTILATISPPISIDAVHWHTDGRGKRKLPLEPSGQRS
jgi:hypothetical protein